MNVYRIAKEKYINDLSGSGARIYGGRWNYKGSSVIYASETRALASIEYLVHLPISIIPDDLCIASIEINDKISHQIMDTGTLPRNWREFPSPSQLGAIGSDWILHNQSLLLRVPSVLVENEYNILINPAHPDIRYVKIHDIKKYSFDKRLLN
ncbi:MAG: RES family NAD+ phosphorylase [Leptospirales bacterium]